MAFASVFLGTLRSADTLQQTNDSCITTFNFRWSPFAVETMDTINFLISINNVAGLYAQDGQFLGLLSNNRLDPNSISNMNGNYGSFWGANSIRNTASMYGGGAGLYSPYSMCCINPPFVLYHNQAALVVTKNLDALTNGLQIVDPDLLLGVYASF